MHNKSKHVAVEKQKRQMEGKKKKEVPLEVLKMTPLSDERRNERPVLWNIKIMPSRKATNLLPLGLWR